MKKTILILSLLLISTGSFSQIQLSVRPGFSTATGLIGIEARSSHLSLFGGYMGNAPAPQAGIGHVSYESSDKKRLTLGANYYVDPSGSSFYTGVNIMTNSSYHSELTNSSYQTEYYSMYYLIIGYRFAFLKYVDLNIGGGFGGSNIGFDYAVDASLGICFPSH